MRSTSPRGDVRRRARVLPGFGLALGFTVLYLGLIVLLPLAALALRTTSQGWAEFVQTVSAPRVLASYRLSFTAAAVAAAVNTVFGLLVAWVLVRYAFPGRALIDGLIDLPFALPTAVGGIALTAAWSGTGWIGHYLEAAGIRAAFTPLGIVVALTFIGLPFVVRTVQPVLQDVDGEMEEAAVTLGAGRWTTVRRVVFPVLAPAVVTGFTLAFARALGEYGSVVFIAGNMPMRTEIAPLLIMTKLEQFDEAGATAIAVVMLAASFVLLLAINLTQAAARRRSGA
jgi:sulfate/thiosulfate transport system permease protein